MHGFNRLGGNSLAETLVAGRIVGIHAARHAREAATSTNLGLVRAALAAEQRRIDDWLARPEGDRSIYAIRDALGEIMIGKVGIFRNGAELAEAVTEIDQLREELGRTGLRCRAPGVNPELSFALRLSGMLRLARVTASGALARTESRGAHARVDFPARDDLNWLNRTLVHWGREEAAPRFSYEPVGLLDLPPGERGYGKSKHVEMSMTLDEYNAGVDAAQREAGRPEPSTPLGHDLKPGAWREAANG
jgi:fumarate reductase flavoprotein subunit